MDPTQGLVRVFVCGIFQVCMGSTDLVIGPITIVGYFVLLHYLRIYEGFKLD